MKREKKKLLVKKLPNIEKKRFRTFPIYVKGKKKLLEKTDETENACRFVVLTCTHHGRKGKKATKESYQY